MKIFLSSTYVDLREVRSRLREWLTGVFGVELIVMETFGSDNAPPDIAAISRVRSCDLFIGIYGFRYGTVDPTTGKSVTELELEEAERALSAGTLKDILLYTIAPDSGWLSEYKEDTAVAQRGLERLKQKVFGHTWSPFSTDAQLTFHVSRDVYRRIVAYLQRSPRQLRTMQLPALKGLSQPIGMEFIHSSQRDSLIGRAEKVTELTELLRDNPVVLLVGDSGVGKTSLVHAGLLPACVAMGWRPIYTRPFGLPATDIARQVDGSVFDGYSERIPSLIPEVTEVSSALGEQVVLLVVDQFEDILSARDASEGHALVAALTQLRSLGLPTVRVLVSYRADLEGRLGEHWQAVSGSPNGLPRVYVSGVDPARAWAGVKRSATALSLHLSLSDAEVDRVTQDIRLASAALGFADVYPPYLQMLIHHIWSSAKEAGHEYTFAMYNKGGGMNGIVGGFLSRQMSYAEDAKGHIRAVLTSLVRSYGVRAQRSIDEIVADTGLTQTECEASLERLIDLRLARHIQSLYEVTHDFLARKIVAELLDSEEREFKRFRELLSSKAAAYQTTRNILSSEEILLLYKYRRRVLPSDPEIRLLLASWIASKGPGLHWLMSVQPTKILELIRAEEPGRDRDSQVSAVLLRRKLTDQPLTEADYSAFRDYKRAAELSWLVRTDPLRVPNTLLVYGHRHWREELRDACVFAIVEKLKAGELAWIPRLRNSSSLRSHAAYAGLVLRSDVDLGAAPDRTLGEFSALRGLARSRGDAETQRGRARVRALRSRRWIREFAKGLQAVRLGKIEAILDRIPRLSVEKFELQLLAVDKTLSRNDYEHLLKAYVTHAGDGEKGTQLGAKKLERLANAILASTTHWSTASLRKAVKALPLAAVSRSVVLALFRYGTFEDVLSILRRVRRSKARINWDNHTGLGREAAYRASVARVQMRADLLDDTLRREFATYLTPEERRSSAKEDLLGLENGQNRALYIRLTAFAIIGAATGDHQADLIRLSLHPYELIARAAAVRLATLIGAKSLDALSESIDSHMHAGRTESLAQALRDAEMRLSEVTGDAEPPLASGDANRRA